MSDNIGMTDSPVLAMYNSDFGISIFYHFMTGLLCTYHLHK